MKTVFVLFDSLNRHMLGPYGGTKVPTPNFDRLAERTGVYDSHYVGSMPCMPARRDLMTGRLTFLHRSWGPLEPFDNAFPEQLRGAGVHFAPGHRPLPLLGGRRRDLPQPLHHLRLRPRAGERPVEGGGAAAVGEAAREVPRRAGRERRKISKYGPYMINREYIREEKDFPSVQVLRRGRSSSSRRNRDADDWLLQVETFDPHEPFYAPERFKEPSAPAGTARSATGRATGGCEELPEEADELRANYHALMALCDDLLGKILDDFDAHDLWKDTALIVTTDHGFLLGEHDFWAKNRMTMYEEIAHIPLFVHDPRDPRAERVDAADPVRSTSRRRSSTSTA